MKSGTKILKKARKFEPYLPASVVWDSPGTNRNAGNRSNATALADVCLACQQVAGVPNSLPGQGPSLSHWDASTTSCTLALKNSLIKLHEEGGGRFLLISLPLDFPGILGFL
ncbi:unnamed protein product [Ostreobium quekettii]|uniref:Uncharacterized protein n=1 Tax=Ostreobium quekettii TaxID=121088 RepID=A0A8S1JIA1_9CHLO|nr:unnamed protein product [Ostreobium quekettii]